MTEAKGGRAKPQESVHSSYLDMVYVTSAYTLLVTVHSTAKPTDNRQEYTLPGGKHGKRELGINDCSPIVQSASTAVEILAGAEVLEEM